MNQNEVQAGSYLLGDFYQVYVMKRAPRWGNGLMKVMGLDNMTPDGLTLGQRLFNTSSLDGLTTTTDGTSLNFSDLREILQYLDILVANIEKNNLSTEEAALAYVLAAIVTQQIVREESICPMAVSIAKRVSQARPDLIQPHLVE